MRGASTLPGIMALIHIISVLMVPISASTISAIAYSSAIAGTGSATRVLIHAHVLQID